MMSSRIVMVLKSSRSHNNCDYNLNLYTITYDILAYINLSALPLPYFFITFVWFIGMDYFLLSWRMWKIGLQIHMTHHSSDPTSGGLYWVFFRIEVVDDAWWPDGWWEGVVVFVVCGSADLQVWFSSNK